MATKKKPTPRKKPEKGEAVRTIIAGSRRITDPAIVGKAVEASGFDVSVVVSGCAPGVDSLGEAWAKENGIPIDPHPAEWSKYGRRAGPIRNQRMIDYGKAEALVAIPDDKSIGTLDMIQRAKRHGLHVYIHEQPKV